MAIIAVEGFDMYNGVLNSTPATAVGVASRWSVYGSNLNFSVVAAGRFGGQAVGYTTSYQNQFALALPGSYSSGCVGFAFYVTSTSNYVSFFTVATSATTYDLGQFNVRITSGGGVAIYRGVSTLLATSATTPIATGVWNYMEVEFTIDNTVGSVAVYINNDPTPVVSVSGVDTQNEATNKFSWFIFTNPINGITYYDDLYITDTPNRLGEQRVVTTYVNGDASPSSWTSSNGSAAPYTMIDETLCDGDTTYVSSSTLNARAMFETASLSVVPTNVQAVQLSCMARKTDTGLRKIQLQYEDTSANVASSSEFTLGTGYSHPVALYPNNPLTSNPWSASDINSMKIGVKVSG